MTRPSSHPESSRSLAASDAVVAAEKRRLTTVARALIAVEGVLCLVLGGAGVVVAAQATTPTVFVVGFKAGLPQFLILTVTGVVLLAALAISRALRRVVLIKAIVFAALRGWRDLATRGQLGPELCSGHAGGRGRTIGVRPVRPAG